MSEINKPEDKKTNLNCPFKPEQYQIGKDSITVPAGTFAWASSHVYLGKQVYRSGWNAPKEHMRLAHKSEAGSAGDGAAYIEKSDNEGYWAHWQPTQEDLMACDWNLLKSESKPEPKPVDCMLEFDLKVGVGTWGFGRTPLGGAGTGKVVGVAPFGELNMKSNNLDILNILAFCSTYGYGWGIMFFLGITTRQDKESYQKVRKLFQNNDLWVTVDSKHYNLGHPSERDTNSLPLYDYLFAYSISDDAEKLSEVIKQHENKTMHVCLNWK
ncbi:MULTISPECIES: MW1434 family type I TA system toxin [Xenorhabdus]|uniref:Thoeris anti-defense Tad2 family protein n=1 Tax=Xenorhabdus TaxID=626 RepID=UPI0006454F9C|nr:MULTISPECIES: MW1434 family type I TA system toxin [Xenorhabdus]